MKQKLYIDNNLLEIHCTLPGLSSPIKIECKVSDITDLQAFIPSVWKAFGISNEADVDIHIDFSCHPHARAIAKHCISMDATSKSAEAPIKSNENEQLTIGLTESSPPVDDAPASRRTKDVKQAKQAPAKVDELIQEPTAEIQKDEPVPEPKPEPKTEVAKEEPKSKTEPVQVSDDGAIEPPSSTDNKYAGRIDIEYLKKVKNRRFFAHSIKKSDLEPSEIKELIHGIYTECELWKNNSPEEVQEKIEKFVESL